MDLKMNEFTDLFIRQDKKFFEENLMKSCVKFAEIHKFFAFENTKFI